MTLRPHHLWTIGGAVMVGNNLLRWNDSNRQTTTYARNHPYVTAVVLAAYMYHFYLEDHVENARIGH